MLNKNKLKSDLQAIFDDLSDKSLPDRLGEIADAIVAYLGDASVGLPPSGTGSGVTFPAASAIKGTLKGYAAAIENAGPGAGPVFATALMSAIPVGTAASIGGADGAPMAAAGFVQIVSEIGVPPIMPVIYLPPPGDQTSADAAGAIADAVHNSVTSILFTTVQMLPTPAGPVPTPVPGIKIS